MLPRTLPAPARRGTPPPHGNRHPRGDGALTVKARIRPATPEDGEAYFDLAETTIAESDFLMRGPGEGPRSADAWREAIERHKRQGDFDLVAEMDGQLVGMSGAIRGEYARNKHVATLGIAIRQSHARQGIGAAMMLALEDWARGQGVTRLELSVMRTNKAARRFYRRLGYRTEGRKRRAVKLGDSYVDEVIMAKQIL